VTRTEALRWDRPGCPEIACNRDATNTQLQLQLQVQVQVQVQLQAGISPGLASLVHTHSGQTAGLRQPTSPACADAKEMAAGESAPDVAAGQTERPPNARSTFTPLPAQRRLPKGPYPQATEF
jgi:hypothetical protein